jgi:hypothetical protein
MTWISTKERLPAQGKSVLVVLDVPGLSQYVEAATRSLLDPDSWWIREKRANGAYISHWMPLPDPPNPPTGG